MVRSLLDPYEAFPFIPSGVVGAILDGRSEEGISLNGTVKATEHELYAKLNEGFTRKEHTECWLWEKGTTSGYGFFRYKGKVARAHIVAYELKWGKLHHGEYVKQTCGNKTCVNPEHLIAAARGEELEKVKNFGEKNGQAKATADEVIALRQAYQRGVPIKKLAEDFSIPFSTVKKIVRYQSWKHLP